MERKTYRKDFEKVNLANIVIRTKGNDLTSKVFILIDDLLSFYPLDISNLKGLKKKWEICKEKVTLTQDFDVAQLLDKAIIAKELISSSTTLLDEAKKSYNCFECDIDLLDNIYKRNKELLQLNSDIEELLQKFKKVCAQ